MLETYIVIACILTFASIIASFVAIINWSGEKSAAAESARLYGGSYPNNGYNARVKRSARHCLLAFAAIPASWAWPLTVTAVVMYLISRVVMDATRPDTTTD